MDFRSLAQSVWSEYHRQPGLKCVLIEGEPAIGLRYTFENDEHADRFLVLRNLHHSFKPENANALMKDGEHVIEIWRR